MDRQDDGDGTEVEQDEPQDVEVRRDLAPTT
jgi:hypothetical protein